MHARVLHLFAGLLAGSIFGLAASGALAQFAAGQPVEYSRTGGDWRPGVVIGPLPGGTQWLIHEEPSQFFPQGSEAAYSTADLRPRQPDAAQPAGNGAGVAPFAPGQTIEYKTGFPATWVAGEVVGMLPGDTQVLIREAPNRFFPEGFERAYALDEVRPAGGGDALAPAVDPAAGPNPPPVVVPPGADVPDRPGLLGEEDVLAYARQVMGPDPWGNPNREQALAQIRDHIRAHGVDFSWSLDFDNRLGALGAASVENTSAISANFGANPKLADYFGTYVITTQNRNGPLIIGQTAGTLQILADGTYSWDVGGDGANVVNGVWEEAAANEKLNWEGGPAMWLRNARDGQDYQVRVDRQPGWDGWIDVGQGTGRIGAHYGKKV